VHLYPRRRMRPLHTHHTAGRVGARQTSGHGVTDIDADEVFRFPHRAAVTLLRPPSPPPRIGVEFLETLKGKHPPPPPFHRRIPSRWSIRGRKRQGAAGIWVGSCVTKKGAKRQREHGIFDDPCFSRSLPAQSGAGSVGEGESMWSIQPSVRREVGGKQSDARWFMATRSNHTPPSPNMYRPSTATCERTACRQHARLAREELRARTTAPPPRALG
jgi:hypothetical protein